MLDSLDETHHCIMYTCCTKLLPQLLSICISLGSNATTLFLVVALSSVGGLLPHTWSGCPTRIQAVQASIASLLVLRLICRNLFCDAGQQPCSCCLLGTLSDVLHCSRPCAAPGANQIPGELQLLTCSSIYCVLRLSNRALLSFLVWLPLPIFALCIYV